MDATVTADGVYIHAEGPSCWCGPSVTPRGVGHNMQAGQTHQLVDSGLPGMPEALPITQAG